MRHLLEQYGAFCVSFSQKRQKSWKQSMVLDVVVDCLEDVRRRRRRE